MTSRTAPERAGWELDAEHREFQAVCRTFTDRHVRPAVDWPSWATIPGRKET